MNTGHGIGEKLRRKILSGGALVLASTAAVIAQQNPFMQPGTGQPPALPQVASTAPAATNASFLNQFFNGRIPDAIANGKFNLNVRLRYEQVDEDGVAAITGNSYAPTVRTRFGYTTAPLYGFNAMVEGVNVSVLGPEHNYNAAGSNRQGSRPVVADPPLTRLDQAWLAYNYTNYFAAKVGRERIVLDNHRFVGDVGWRQNMQTYDAVSATGEPVKNLDLYYAYIWDVHRVFGDVSGLPGANRDFDSSSHLVNLSYSGWKYGRFAAYTYLLDLHNPAGDANSCVTYGAHFSGAAPLTDKISADYRAEFAWQTDYADSPLDYATEYFNLESGATIKPVAFGGGYESLGSGANSGAGGGRASFRTPLATLHAFNGWADAFLATPSDGLRDLYAYAQVTLPARIPLRFVYHKFDAEFAGGDYGQEFDAVISRKFGKHWTGLIKYAYYDGADAATPALAVANVSFQKFWAQVEFNF